MKKYTSLLLIAIATCASAGEKKAAILETNGPSRFDVKGAILGSSIDELKSQVDAELMCRKTDPKERMGEVDQLCWIKGENECVTIGTYHSCHDKPRAESFAGHSVIICYKLRDGSLWQISIVGLAPDLFDSVLETMQTKYGKAAVQRSDVQNRMGAHFSQGIAVWSGVDHIVYEKYLDSINDPSRLEFYGADAWAQREAKIRQSQEKAKSDM